MEINDIGNTFKDSYLIYNRRSTDDADNQRNSLMYQRQRNLEHVEHSNPKIFTATNLTVRGFCTNGIIDESHSAFKQEDEFIITADGAIQYRILRPKFLILVGLLQSHKIRGVIFLCWDRASRNEQDDLIIKKLKQMGCDIRFVEATYEDTSAGKLHMRVDGMFSSHYSEVISEKVRGAQKKLRGERRCIYAAPIGYLDRGSDNKPFDPERAPLVKRIFEQYATGDWSIQQLGKWAREQGLTKRPTRRNRTKEEIANNVDVATIPKIAHPVDHKTIEYMLPNPFYIAKVKIVDHYEDSTAHQALIDDSLFFKVQAMLKQKRVSVYYMDKGFHTYRELTRCACGRAYSPYEQKGIIYYRSRCKEGCTNSNPNLNESDITTSIQRLLDEIHFTEDELLEIEGVMKSEMSKISKNRDKVMADLQTRQRTINADIDYIVQNKITLLRTGTMDADAIREEQKRLEAKLAVINNEIKVYAESIPEMLRYIMTFSEVVKDAGVYFKFALDSEKREITSLVFTELVFKDRQLISYEANDGFKALLKRKASTQIQSSLPHFEEIPQNRMSGSGGRIRTASKSPEIPLPIGFHPSLHFESCEGAFGVLIFRMNLPRAYTRGFARAHKDLRGMFGETKKNPPLALSQGAALHISLRRVGNRERKFPDISSTIGLRYPMIIIDLDRKNVIPGNSRRKERHILILHIARAEISPFDLFESEDDRIGSILRSLDPILDIDLVGTERRTRVRKRREHSDRPCRIGD